LSGGFDVLVEVSGLWREGEDEVGTIGDREGLGGGLEGEGCVGGEPIGVGVDGVADALDVAGELEVGLVVVDGESAADACHAGRALIGEGQGDGGLAEQEFGVELPVITGSCEVEGDAGDVALGVEGVPPVAGVSWEGVADALFEFEAFEFEVNGLGQGVEAAGEDESGAVGACGLLEDELVSTSGSGFEVAGEGDSGVFGDVALVVAGGEVDLGGAEVDGGEAEGLVLAACLGLVVALLFGVADESSEVEFAGGFVLDDAEGGSDEVDGVDGVLCGEEAEPVDFDESNGGGGCGVELLLGCEVEESEVIDAEVEGGGIEGGAVDADFDAKAVAEGIGEGGGEVVGVERPGGGGGEEGEEGEEGDGESSAPACGASESSASAGLGPGLSEAVEHGRGVVSGGFG
jgi:hypothetical protein